LFKSGYTEQNVKLGGLTKKQKVMSVSAILLTATVIAKELADDISLTEEEKKYVDSIQETLWNPQLFYKPYVKFIDMTKFE